MPSMGNDDLMQKIAERCRVNAASTETRTPDLYTCEASDIPGDGVMSAKRSLHVHVLRSSPDLRSVLSYWEPRLN